MNPVFRIASSVVALLLGATLIAAAADSKEFERRKAPPKKFTGINFAEPDAAGNTNKVGDSLLPKPSLGSIDRAIRKPFEILSSEDGAGPVLGAPPRRPPPRPPSRQERLKKDVQANWVFSTPEEIFGLPTAETMLDLPEFGPSGELRSPRTSLERYLERKELERQATSTNQAAGGLLPAWARPDEETATDAAGKDNDSGSEKDQPENQRSGGYEFVTMSGTPAWQQSAPNSDGLFRFSTFSSAAATAKSPGKDTAREQRMQEFRQLLDGRPVASPSPIWSVGGSVPLASPATLTPSPALSLSTPFNRAATTPTAPSPTAASVLSPAGTTPGYLTPAAPLPGPAPVTRPQPSPPPFTTPFDLPRRKF